MDFHDISNLEKVESCSVSPHKPGSLCVMPPSTILFMDKSDQLHTRRIKRLDCSVSSPRLIEDIFVAKPGNHPLYYLSDLLFVEHKNRSLLVATSCTKTMAFEIKSGILRWEVDIQSVADLRGGRQARASPRGSKFSHFHAVFGQKFKNNPILGVGGPSIRKLLDPSLQWPHEKGLMSVADPSPPPLPAL